jgi:hypothetical protein
MTVKTATAMVPTRRPTIQEDRPMEPMSLPAHDFADPSEEELLVHAWRTEQLGRLGVHRLLAESFADLVDWHALAKLVERGCSPELALEIVR